MKQPNKTVVICALIVILCASVSKIIHTKVYPELSNDVTVSQVDMVNPETGEEGTAKPTDVTLVNQAENYVDPVIVIAGGVSIVYVVNRSRKKKQS